MVKQRVKAYMSSVEQILKDCKLWPQYKKTHVTLNRLFSNDSEASVNSDYHNDKNYSWGVRASTEFEEPSSPEEVLTIQPTIFRIAYFEILEVRNTGSRRNNYIKIKSSNFDVVTMIHYFLNGKKIPKKLSTLEGRDLYEAIRVASEFNFPKY